MRTEISKDPYHSWLVFSEGMEMDRDAYQIHMITENDIPGFLNCRIREIDQQMRFWYDITGKTSLKQMLENSPADRKLLERLFADLSEALRSVNEYLLDQDHLGLQPEWIYMDRKERRFSFVYCPAMDADFSDSCRAFGESLLPRLDHRDRKAVVLGYSFYQRCVDGIGDPRSFPELPELLDEEEDGREENRKADAETPDAELFFQEVQPEKNRVICSGLFGLLERWRIQRAERKAEKRAKRLRRREERKRRKAERQRRKEERKRIQEDRWKETCAKNGESEKISAWEQESFSDFIALREDGAGTLTKADADSGREAVFEEQRNTERNRIRNKESNPDVRQVSREINGNAETICLGKPPEFSLIRKERARLIPLHPGEKTDGKIEENGSTAILLVQDSYVIGKNAAAAQIILQSAAVSRVHARLLWDGAAYRLTDLNSRNGTKVNGEWISDEEMRPLADGDRLVFADLSFTYLSRGESNEGRSALEKEDNL